MGTPFDFIFFNKDSNSNSLWRGKPVFPAHLLSDSQRELVERTAHIFSTDLEDRNGSFYHRKRDSLCAYLKRRVIIPDGTLFPSVGEEKFFVSDTPRSHYKKTRVPHRWRIGRIRRMETRVHSSRECVVYTSRGRCKYFTLLQRKDGEFARWQ